jgi:hypothetical protein
MTTNYTPFVYLLDERDSHQCDLMGCDEPVYAIAMFRVDSYNDEPGEQEIYIRLCVPHFVALQKTSAHPHGEER